MTIRPATRPIKSSPQTMARLAGFLYLLTIPLGVFALLVVPSRLIVPGDATATASNVVVAEPLFRLGIASALLGQVIGVMYVLILYRLFKPVHQPMAVLMVVFSLLGIPMTMLNELSQLAALELLSGVEYLSVFTAEQLQSLALFFLGLHEIGLSIAAIFWGLWLFPLGYLVFKSGFLPRILGVLLVMAGSGYLIDSFAFLLFPAINLEIGLVTGWGELIFLLWLLVKGVNAERWQLRAAAVLA